MSIARLLVLLLIIVLFILLPGCAADPDRGELILAEIPAPSLQGSLLPNEPSQPALVYLPPAHRSGTGSFPVLYYLPGFATDVTEYLDQSFQGMNVRIVMDELIRLKRIRPMILVIVNGRNSLGGSFYVNSPVTGRWADFVARDAVGYADRTWRTIASPESRGLAGDSMGGSGALALAMSHPGTFGAVYSMSPGILPRDGVLREWLFADEEQVRDDLRVLGEIAGLPAAEALPRFGAFLGSLASRGGRESLFRIFAFAYGAAFAPDPEGAPPWIDYPFRLRGGRLEARPVSLARYDRGLGGLGGKISRHAGDLKRLRGLVLDYGRRDELEWIPDGVRRLSHLLEEAGVSHQVRAHDGTHTGSLRFRFVREMLPFFSSTLEGAGVSVAPALTLEDLS